jgi:hypothetical protein
MSLERDDKLLVKFTVEVGIAEGRELELGEHATREVIEDLHIDAAIRNKVNVMLDSRIGLSYDDGVYTSVEQEVHVGIGRGHAQECPCRQCRPEVDHKYTEAVRECKEIDRKEAFAAMLFDSDHWDEDSPRPSEETAHKLAEEIIAFIS